MEFLVYLFSWVFEIKLIWESNVLTYTTQRFVDVRDFNNLVVETYGKPYNFQQQDGCKERGTYNLTVPEKYDCDFENDTIPEVINGNEMGVSFNAWLARDPKEWNGAPKDTRSLDLFWERNFYPSIETLANDLYSKGLIEAGKYVINIDW